MTDDLLNDFKKSFEKMRKELGFNATLEEFDEVFYFSDFILQTGFVSPKLSRYLCGRMRDTFSLWINQLHQWLFPNPSSIISMQEAELFDEVEKEEITLIMRKFLAFTSLNGVIGLSKNKKEEAAYFDKGLKLWKENKKFLSKFSNKTFSFWND